MITLLKKRVVLVHDEEIVTAACFGLPDSLAVHRIHVDLTLHEWQDMGSPDQITVTIEPGDRLND